MPRKAGRRKRMSSEVVLLKTVRFKFWITGNSGILGSGCHSCRRELLTKTGCISLNAAFCRLVFLQLPSSQIDMAEACGSRTQTFNSQLTANDDVAASAKFQLESIGVRWRFAAQGDSGLSTISHKNFVELSHFLTAHGMSLRNETV